MGGSLEISDVEIWMVQMMQHFQIYSWVRILETGKNDHPPEFLGNITGVKLQWNFHPLKQQAH